MNWKKLSGLISVVVVCLAMISVTACSSPNESRYNPNPDVSGKVIGSDNDFISRVIPVILNDVLYSSNCVIIGEVLDDNVVESKLEVPWGTMPWYHTIASVKVLETISGEPPSSDIISYRQGGVGDSYQTKVKKGNTYVLVLIYSNSLDQYMATSFEDSVFMVDGKNKLMSLSAQPCCARYDGIDLSILIEDVRQDRIDNAVWYEWYQDIRKTWD